MPGPVPALVSGPVSSYRRSGLREARRSETPWRPIPPARLAPSAPGPPCRRGKERRFAGSTRLATGRPVHRRSRPRWPENPAPGRAVQPRQCRRLRCRRATLEPHWYPRRTPMCRLTAPQHRQGRSRSSRTAHRTSLTPAGCRRPAQGVPLTPVSGVASSPWPAPRWLPTAPRPTMVRWPPRWMGLVGRPPGPNPVGPLVRPDRGWKGRFRARRVLPAARCRGPPQYLAQWPDCRWMAGRKRPPSRRDAAGRQAGLPRANPLVRPEAKLEAVRPKRLDGRRQEPRRRCADLARCCVDLTRRPDCRCPYCPCMGAPRRRKQRRPGLPYRWHRQAAGA